MDAKLQWGNGSGRIERRLAESRHQIPLRRHLRLRTQIVEHGAIVCRNAVALQLGQRPSPGDQVVIWPLAGRIGLCVDGKPAAEFDGLGPDLRLDHGVVVHPIGCQPVQNLGNHAADLLKLRDSEATRGAGRCAETDT